jgi:hypothetical protein
VARHRESWPGTNQSLDTWSGDHHVWARTFDTQQQAIDAARDTARREKSEMLIQGEDGEIRERNSYGNDPHPPKG